MSAKHTPGQLEVAVEVFDNDGMPETVIQGLGTDATVAVALDFGPNNPEMRDANARRLVACWNACAGIETHALELMTGDLAIKEQITASGKAKQRPATFRAVVYRRQRDELLSVCKQVIEENLHLADGEVCTLAKLKQAIGKAEGGAA